MVKTTLLGAGLWGRSQQVGLEYVLRIDPNRLLAPVFTAMGRPDEALAPAYGGWESRPIAGHSLGHYLSALAEFWTATGDGRVKGKLDYTVAVLAGLQDSQGYLGGVPRSVFDQVFTGNFEVDNFSLGGWWVPWYSVHKIYAGLIDGYLRGGTFQALTVVKKMAVWAWEGTRSLSFDQFQKMLVCEHGGMVKAFADLYGITKDQRFLALAERFIHHNVVDPLMEGRDCLQGLHANTQIPKLIGLARLYELTDKAGYRRAAEFFFQTVKDHRSYAIGGNSIGEHFGPPDREPLGRDTCETCNTYNMVELAGHIYRWTQDPAVADFCEKALFNHILASQEPDTGAKTYFVSLDPGHFKVYGTEDDSFWCCTGTGMENPARYHRSVAHSDGKTLTLNQYLPSVVETPGLRIRIETNYPLESRVDMAVEKAGEGAQRLRLRRPGWMEAPLVVHIDGVAWGETRKPYLDLPEGLKEGCRISFDLPLDLRLEKSREEDHRTAVFQGPLVLAAGLGRDDFPPSDVQGDHLALMGWNSLSVPPVVISDQAPQAWIRKSASGAGAMPTFEILPGLMKEGAVPLVPFFALHHQRYTVYFDLFTPEEAAAGLSQRQTRDKLFQDRTVDLVKIGQQQSEVDHQLESRGSFSGYVGSVNLFWRDARWEGNYFAYTMKFVPERDNLLQITCYGKDVPGPGYRRRFRILVNNRELTVVDWEGDGQDEVTDLRFPVPQDFISDIPVVSGGVLAQVRFETCGMNFAGGIFEIRVLKIG